MESTAKNWPGSWGLKNVHRGRIRKYADRFKKAIFMPIETALDHNPLWNIRADCAFPGATQNEINAKDAANLIMNGVKLVAEGANMPSTLDATKMFLDAKILYGPAKAANAGGVATSGLEMAQDGMRLAWSREEVDSRLHQIMIAIHRNCYETAETYATPGNLVNGANIAGFLKVANAMLDQGLVKSRIQGRVWRGVECSHSALRFDYNQDLTTVIHAPSRMVAKGRSLVRSLHGIEVPLHA